MVLMAQECEHHGLGDGVKICPRCLKRHESALERCPEDGSALLALGKDDPRIGTVAHGRFIVLDRLGAGGMGVVYRAHQLSVDRPVALKILSSGDVGDPELVQRFSGEAKSM